VRADKSIAVRESAHVTGNISAPSVTIQEGAKFTGHVDMSGNAAAKSALPVEAAAARRLPGPA
jgi:cytoskeletal protein CcmA (bactofilin family)